MADIKNNHDERQRRLLQEYIFNLEDIQEQAEELSAANEKLRQSQNMLMAVVENTPYGLCFLRNHIFVWCNYAFLNILGWEYDEVIGKPIGILHADFEKDIVAEIISGSTHKMSREYDFRHKDGRLLSCLVTGRLVNIDVPSTYILSVVDFTGHKQMEEELRHHRDCLEGMVKERTARLLTANNQLHIEVNERRWAEEALRESEEKYRTILLSIKEGYFELDFSGNVTFFNDVACRSSQYKPEEILGINYNRFCTTQSATTISKMLRKIHLQETEKPSKTIDFEIIRKDGKIITVEASVTVMLDKNGQPAGLRFVTRDITERKKAQEEREKLITDLREALANVKILSGLLPICSSCKKIRNDDGYWEQIESYIRNHSGAEFTHGICPDCRKKLYPNI